MGGFLVYISGVFILAAMITVSIVYMALKKYAEKIAELTAKDHYENILKKA